MATIFAVSSNMTPLRDLLSRFQSLAWTSNLISVIIGTLLVNPGKLKQFRDARK